MRQIYFSAKLFVFKVSHKFSGPKDFITISKCINVRYKIHKQRRCLTKIKKRWNARLETERWVFGSAR